MEFLELTDIEWGVISAFLPLEPGGFMGIQRTM
jgi:hypothetical protein